jgi:hypothetical protein
MENVSYYSFDDEIESCVFQGLLIRLADFV